MSYFFLSFFASRVSSYGYKKTVQSTVTLGYEISIQDYEISNSKSCIKTESIRKLSNLNFHWTKTLYQNNLNNTASFFTYLYWQQATDQFFYKMNSLEIYAIYELIRQSVIESSQFDLA